MSDEQMRAAFEKQYDGVFRFTKQEDSNVYYWINTAYAWNIWQSAWQAAEKARAK